MKWRRRFLIALLAIVGLYIAGRGYYALTDGFLIENITASFPYHPEWETRPLNEAETKTVAAILSQPFHYLGKGCQAYVFESADEEYVIKFFKFQRYRPQMWTQPFQVIPVVSSYLDRRQSHKEHKLAQFFEGWKTAFNSLQRETALLYVHLNTTPERHGSLVIHDKLGTAHLVDLDSLPFLIQRKALMLCPALEGYMAAGKEREAKQLIDRLIDQILDENRRGFVDKDNAIMQNTGVINGRPIHIDVGQFAFDASIQNPARYKQGLFNKTYRFHQWLTKRYPTLATYLQGRLFAEIGPEMHAYKPHKNI